MAEIMNIQQLPESVRLSVVGFVEKLLRLHEENVLAVAVYGSAVGVNFNPKTSDVNLAVVLKTLTHADLKKTLPLVREGMSRRISAPLFLTREYIQQSLDVFPIEFLDLRDHHILLFGEDILSSLNVDERYLKLFCEQQIKGKLLRIRQAYLEIGLDGKGKEALLKDSLRVSLPVFRHLLRLVNHPVPSGREDLFKALGLSFGIDSTVLSAIHRDRVNDERIAGRDVDDYLERYLMILEQLATKVD